MLDSKRLGNQRVEARMILRWLRNPAEYPRQQNAGYTIMWKGYEDALCLYYNACCEEWARRGGQNIVCQPEPVSKNVRLPPWLGDDKMHKTHRSALLYKLPDHYKQFGWEREISDPKVEYLWPRPLEGGGGNEYELCPPAFWKKKKATASPRVSTKKEKENHDKKRPKRARTATVEKKRDDAKQQQRYPSRKPRRSPRLRQK